ncbi:MAG: hypothetical protein NXI16_18470, partial [Alphaproteobacteria bacterium]|nr:hypothetical protein [Alphaproteobacteria bacterium]
VVCEPGDVPDGQGGCKADVIIHGTRPDNDCPPGAICIDGDGINFFDPGLLPPPLDIDIVDFGGGGNGDGDQQEDGEEEKKQCGPNGEPRGFTTVPKAPGANPNLPNPYMRGPDGRLHHTPAWHDAMIESRARASNGGGILGYVLGSVGAANGVAGLGGAAPAAAAAPFAVTFGSIAAIATAVAPPEPLMPSMPEPPRC